ncbi:MAG: class I SAM-dependent methyltransferase [Parachlamydiaceae bacterium]
MKQVTYFTFFCFCFCFNFLKAQHQTLDEPLSKESWSRFGPLSQHYILGRKEKPDAVYAILKSYVSVNASVLDLGSGTGISTRQLHKNGFKNVIGVDRDLLMIKEAQAANNKLCTIKYIQADIALGLPFADEQFDVVTAASAFHWFSNESSTKEVARILKPNGYYFVIGGKGRYQESKKPDLLKQNIERIIQDSGVVRNKGKNQSVVDVLEAQGFKIIVDATVPYSHYYTKQEYLHRVQSQSLWNLVNDSLRPALLKKIEQYLDTVVDKQGLIKKEGSVSVVLAQKRKGDSS